MTEALRHSALLTDLYELTMAAAYFENGFRDTGSFELFVRSLPPQRGYLLTAGLEQALDFVEGVRFQPEDISFLRRHSAFAHVSDAFFDYLKTFRFTGEVWAVPEGTPIFSEEPLVRVTGPIIEAQIVETLLLSALTFQTMIASKGARGRRGRRTRRRRVRHSSRSWARSWCARGAPHMSAAAWAHRT